jgi:hypothetical protein
MGQDAHQKCEGFVWQLGDRLGIKETLKLLKDCLSTLQRDWVLCSFSS